MSDLDTEIPAEAAKEILVNKQYYAGLTVNSPTDLASAIAEHTRKSLGIKVSTVDNGTKSSIVFKRSAFVNQMAAFQNLEPEAIEKLIETAWQMLAAILDMSQRFLQSSRISLSVLAKHFETIV